MPTPTTRVQCRICLAESRSDIEAALHDGRSHKSIATQFAVGRMSVQRHSVKCMALPGATAKLKRSVEIARRRVEQTVAAVVAGVEAPQVRTAEAVQEYNERLLAAFARRRIVAEGIGDDRTFIALGREEKDILANIERNSGRTREAATVTYIDQRQMKIVELYDSLPLNVLRRLRDGETTIESVVDSAHALEAAS